MSTPWNPNNHGFTSGPPGKNSPPGSAAVALRNGNSSTTFDARNNIDSTASSEATRNPKAGPTKEEKGQGQEKSQRATPMIPTQQQMRDQQRPISSTSTTSATSFHAGSSNGIPHPPHHHPQPSSGMGGNNNYHMAPQYRHAPSHHHPSHGQPNHFYNGDQMMGAVRGQGRPHDPDHAMQNNNFHHHNLNRPTGRYPIQHTVPEGFGHHPHPHGHGHGHFGRPGPARNYHQHQQHQPQFHSFPQVPHTKGGTITQGMGQQVGSRGPSPTHPHPQYLSQGRKSVSPIPPGVAVAIAQSQPLRRLSQNSSANNSTDSSSGPVVPHEDTGNPSSNRVPTGSYQSKPVTSQQNQQQQQTSVGHSAPLRPPSQQEMADISSQDQYRHRGGPPDMHQGYQNQPYQNQFPQTDHIHYGGQPPMHNGGHPNSMQSDMQNYNYHHTSHGPSTSGPPLAHNHYRGYPDNGMPTGYPHGPGGHREMYPHPSNQHYHQQHQQPHSYGKPLPPPPAPQRIPGHGFQLPKYNSNLTTSDPATSDNKNESRKSTNRSPSPPPSPPPAPSAQALLRARLRQQEGAKKTTDEMSTSSPTTGDMSINSSTNENPSRRNSSGSHSSMVGNKPTALGDRGNVAVTSRGSTLGKKQTNQPVSKPAKQEDVTADAASILLQLGSMNRSTGGTENQNPCSHPSPPIPSSVQHSSSMDDVSDAGTMLTMQTDVPDLTSGPSSDSIDTEMSGVSASRPMDTPTKSNLTTKVTTKQEPDTDFPCPVPDRYPTRLALPYDNAKLNNLHCFLRSELLEIFVVSKSNKKSPCHSPSSSVGRVGLRCVHCAMNRMSCADAPMSVFYPKSIAEIYRLVTSWQRCHLRKCKKIPPGARAEWQKLRDTDKSRGKTHYWVTSAKQLGLMDCQSRAGGIRFKPDFDPSTLPPNTPLTPSAKEAKEAAERAAAIAAKAQKIVSLATAVTTTSIAAASAKLEESTVMTDAPSTEVLASAAIHT